MGQGVLAERELAQAREAYWWALATTTVLEKWIERLSQSTTRDRPNAHIHSQSHDWWRRRSWGWSRRHCRALPEDSPVRSPMHSPPQWGPETSEDPRGWTIFPGVWPWAPHQSWGWMFSIFFQEPGALQGEGRTSDPTPEPSVENYEKWIEWRSLCICMPDWLKELVGILGIDDFWEHAWRIWIHIYIYI